MHKSIDFLILYQHKSREIDTVCLLKYELERRGYNVQLASVYRYKCKMYCGAKVIVAPFLYHNDNFRLFYNHAGFYDKVVNLQSEQVFSNEDEANVNCYMNPKDAAKQAVHLCWGENQKLRLIAAGVDEKKIFVTGAIQLDMVKPPLSSMYMPKSQLADIFHIDEKKIWTLFISSFACDTLSGDVLKGFIEGGSAIEEFQNIAMISKSKAIVWFEKYVQEYPDRIFIYRPHPAELMDIKLTELSQKYDNFKVIDSYNIKQWINSCENIISWYSTSVAEVYYARKNCVIIRPVEIPTALDVSIYKNAIMCKDYDNMVAQLDQPVFPIDSRLLDRYYYVDNEYAFVRVCDILERVYANDEYRLDLRGVFATSVANGKKCWYKPQFLRDIKFRYYAKLADKYYNKACNLSEKKLKKACEYRIYIRDYIEKEEADDAARKISKLLSNGEVSCE